MNRILLIIAFCLGIFVNAFSQEIDNMVVKKEAEGHLKYLASDDMMGRDTGSPEIKIAAEYIVENFKNYGVKPLPGKDTYYQKVPLLKTNIPEKGELKLLDSTLIHGKNVLILRGLDTTATLPAVFAGYGLKKDIDSIDIEGKFVIAKFGFPGMENVRNGFGKTRDKRKYIADKGGLGLIELYNSRQINWSLLILYLNRSSMIVDDHSESKTNVPYQVFINDADGAYLSKLESEGITEVSVDISGLSPESFVDNNIVGYIRGKNKDLRDEYVILSAHYDHVGHTHSGIDENGEPIDSIFNGARDNALGTTGLLMAAKYFGEVRPERSILFIGFTAEEKGLLGSEYYADNPLVPLNQCIFNINIDCAGYNDKTIATIFGLTRSSAENKFVNACQTFGIKAIDDPVPDQNIFERSDHFNFAKHGIPCVLYGPGLTSFDEEIQKYYHQVTDHAETLDFDYLTKVYKAFIKASESIANDENAPFWVEGDKYEKAGKELYEME